ncbi:chemokine-like receptor 1 [Python bivittatus]|uniref:Chemokine-like receptor 1 n=1 Tax=Python bivittatus TaxID=176946 RepID=A0A9F2R3N4_PYTBI|nr:chemokine-like receptor 1 [Python bivittatus]
MKVNLTTLGLSNASLLPSLETKPDVSRLMDMLQVFFYGVLFLLGSLGNGAVIWVTVRQASRTISCVWFFNLALADFLFSVTRIVPLLKNAFDTGWPFGSFLCKANSFIKYLNMFCSVFLLAAISIDRAASVAYPIWSKRHRDSRLAWIGAIGTWFLAIATSLPFYFYRGIKIDKTNKTKCSFALEGNETAKLVIYMLRLICGFLAPFIIIVICYGIITAILRRRRTSLRSKRPFKVILVLVVTFFLCWAPYHIFLLLKLAEVSGTAISIGFPLSSFLAYLNSCANPILYFFMGMDFHRKLTLFNISAAFRRILLEDSGASLRRPSRYKMETVSSIEEVGQSSVVYQVHCKNSALRSSA